MAKCEFHDMEMESIARRIDGMEKNQGEIFTKLDGIRLTLSDALMGIQKMMNGILIKIIVVVGAGLIGAIIFIAIELKKGP